MGHFLVTGNSILTNRFFNRKRDMTGLEICVVGWAEGTGRSSRWLNPGFLSVIELLARGYPCGGVPNSFYKQWAMYTYSSVSILVDEHLCDFRR